MKTVFEVLLKQVPGDYTCNDHCIYLLLTLEVMLYDILGGEPRKAVLLDDPTEDIIFGDKPYVIPVLKQRY